MQQNREVGGTLPGTYSRGSVEQGGSTTPHKCFRKKSSQIGDRVASAGWKPKSVHLQNDVTALSHLVKIGGTKSRELNKTLKLNWEQDHTYCRIPPKLSKHSDGLGITAYQGLEKVEIVSPDVCKDNSDNGKHPWGKPSVELFAPRL